MVFDRFPLKAVKVMHTVALRTEATISGGYSWPNGPARHYTARARPGTALNGTALSGTVD